MDEAQVRIITKKVLDEEHLLGYIKVFEKEHNLFRGSHDKIQLPAALIVPQQVVNNISGKTKFEDLQDVYIPTKTVGDFIQYNETTEKWTRQAALAEGSIVIAVTDGYFSEDNTNFTWDNTSKIFKVIGSTFLDGAVVINDSNADVDVRVEGSGASYTHLLFIDASANMVGINEDAPKALFHIRHGTCASYAGVHPSTALLIEGTTNVAVQLQAGASNTASIVFADDDYSPPAGRIQYEFNVGEFNFAIEGNVYVWFKATGAIFQQNELEINSVAAAYFTANAHDADAYFALEEDEALKWTVGFDYTDGSKFQISEGIPGTNTVIEIPIGHGSLHFVRAADKGLQYLDTGAGVRWMFRVASGTNVVEILNRASHGKVEVHANTVTAGAGGDVLVATFEDDLVTLAVDLRLSSNKELRFYNNGNYVGFEAPDSIDANQIWVLPGVDGSANEALATAGDGGLIWRTHDELAGFEADEHLPALDEDDLVSDSDTSVATQQSIKAYVDALPGGADEKVKVDAAAAAGYLGVAFGDGVLRVTENELTVVDGGDFITLGLADHATARTALGLAIGTDVAEAGANSDITSMDGITGAIETPTNLGNKTTGAWSKSIGGGGDYADWATMIAAMPDLIAHAVTVTIEAGTTLTEICDIKNKHGITSVGAITIQAEKYFPTAGDPPTADSATATTLRDAALAAAALGNDYFNGCWILITHGTGTDNGFVTITDYVDATGDVVVAAWPGTQPDNTSRYAIVGAMIDGGVARNRGLDIQANSIYVFFKGIGIKDSTQYGIYSITNTTLRFDCCGVYNSVSSGIFTAQVNRTVFVRGGIVKNNTVNDANGGGMRVESNSYFYAVSSGLSDNLQRGISVKYGGFLRSGDLFGDNNGAWGIYAWKSAQAFTEGTECSGAAGNHSDPGTAGNANADQAAAY